ncbi:hypothetical protein MTF65_06020 [Streptomyces sp. APSN-46.1]|nr:hypothetical protein [Streptomyces sp. APSN-46.1]MCJ1676909.1 hypothetical protein [Streptomyces sp. APSN-46.1]
MVRDEQECDALALECAQLVEEPLDAPRVELGGRLVEDDEPGAEDSARAISTNWRCSTLGSPAHAIGATSTPYSGAARPRGGAAASS